MPNSPANCHIPPQNEQILDTQKRLCDFCSKSTALVYCRADNAKLCLSCDREVHSTNQLFTKHTRFQLCDACDSSPASILCFTEQSVLCQNCDYETHTCHGTSANHDRRPLEGFTGQPSVFELSAAIGFGDFDAKCCVSDEEKVNNDGFNGGLFGGLEDDNDGFSDFFAWDVPTTMVSLDELIESTDKTHNFQAMVVPPLPKDRNLSCGQHKHEILRQLCELSKFEPGVLKDGNPIAGQQIISDEDEKDSRVRQKIRASHHDEEHPTFQENEANLHTWCNDGEGVNDVFISTSLLGNHIEESVLKSDSQSGMCSSGNLATSGWNTQYPVSNDSPESFQKVPIRELISADRDSAISRYKEKKRNRRFEKHIRYESRKLQAENRTRIKGRFAKLDNRMNQA